MEKKLFQRFEYVKLYHPADRLFYLLQEKYYFKPQSWMKSLVTMDVFCSALSQRRGNGGGYRFPPRRRSNQRPCALRSPETLAVRLMGNTWSGLYKKWKPSGSILDRIFSKQQCETSLMPRLRRLLFQLILNKTLINNFCQNKVTFEIISSIFKLQKWLTNIYHLFESGADQSRHCDCFH